MSLRPKAITTRIGGYVSAPAQSAPALRCRIEPYLDQGGALRAPRADASARPLPWGPGRARAGPGTVGR
jgi:hypothetical protein